MSVELQVQDTITSSIKAIITKMKALPQDAFVEFVKDTPIRSGNARRSTTLSGNTIKAEYAYAKRLDQGYSKQAPQGMSAPTEAFIKKRITQILAGK
jgi:hypothetical protein